MQKIEIQEVTLQSSISNESSSELQSEDQDSFTINNDQSGRTTYDYAKYLSAPKQSTRNCLNVLTAQHLNSTPSRTDSFGSPRTKTLTTEHSTSPKKEQTFNITKYVPCEMGQGSKITMGQIDTTNYKQDEYAKNFYNEREVNKDKIAQELHMLAMQQIITRINKDPDFDVPPSLEGNKRTWAHYIIKSKKIQKIFCNFTDQIAAILEMEIGKNKKLINDYMNIPHNHPLPKTPKHPSKYKIMSSLDKAKQKISQIQKEVQKKQIEDKIDKEVKVKLESHINELKAQHFDQIVQSKKKGQSQQKKQKHPMAEMFQESMNKQKELLSEIEQNDKEFSAEVENTERQLESMENTQGFSMNPGLGIANLMEKWGQEPVETKAQFKNFATELWKTRTQFEKEIQKEEKGYQIREKYMENNYLKKTREISKKTSFYIEALETALTETKIKAQLEKDRCNMRIAEIESTFFNASKTENELGNSLLDANALLKTNINFNDKKTQEKVIKVLQFLTQSVTGLCNEKTCLENMIKSLEFEIEKMQNKDLDLIAVYNKLLLCQNDLYDQLQFTPFAKPDLPIFSEVEKKIYESLTQAITKFDFNYCKLSIPNQQKLEYLTYETGRITELFKTLNLTELMNKYQLFSMDKIGMIMGTFDELQKIGIFDVTKQDATQEKGQNIQKKSTTDASELLEKMGINVAITPEIQKIMGQLKKSMKKMVKTKQTVLQAEEVLRQEQEDKQYYDGIIKQETERTEKDAQEEKEFNLQSPNSGNLKSLNSGNLQSPNSGSLDDEELPGLPATLSKKKINSTVSSNKNKQTKPEIIAEVKNQGATKQGKQTKPEITTEVKNPAANAKIPPISVTVEESKKQKGSRNKKVIQLNEPQYADRGLSFDCTETLFNEETFTPSNQLKAQIQAQKPSFKSNLEINESPYLPTLTKQSSKNESQMSKNSYLKSPRNGQTGINLTQNVTKIPKSNTNLRGSKSEFAKAIQKIEQNEETPKQEQMGAQEKINQQYKDLIEETQYMDEQLLKFNTSQFEELHREFQVSLDKTLKPNDYMKMFDTMHFDDLFGLINTLIPKYVKQQSQEDFCRLADCIVAEIDPETGSIQGFSLRVNILKVLFYQDSCGIKEIKKVIKRVNYLNRILKSDMEEFGLVKPKPKETKTTESQADIVLPEIVQKIEVTPDIQHLLDEMKSHLIEAAARGSIKRHQYYDLMWGGLNLDELLQVRIPNMQQQEDDESYKSIIGIQAKEYLSSIFKLMNEKILQNTENADEEGRSQSLDVQKKETLLSVPGKPSELFQDKSLRNINTGAKTKQKSLVQRSKQFRVNEIDENSICEKSIHSNFSESPNQPYESQLNVLVQQLPRVLTPRSLIGNTSFKPNSGDSKHIQFLQKNQKLILTDKQTQTVNQNQARQTQTLEEFQPLNATVLPIVAGIKVSNSQSGTITIESPEKLSHFAGTVDQALKNEINRTIETMSDFVSNVKAAKEIATQIRHGSTSVLERISLKGDSPQRTLQNVNDVIAQESNQIKQMTVNMIDKAIKHKETQKTFSNRKTTIDSEATHTTLPMLINGKSGETISLKEKPRFTDSNFVIRPNLKRLDNRLTHTQFENKTKSQFSFDAFRDKYKSPEPSRPILGNTGNISAFALNLDNPAKMQIQLNRLLNETSERNLNKLGTNNTDKHSMQDILNNSGKKSDALMRVPFMGGEPLMVSPILMNQSVKKIAMKFNTEANSVTDILRKRNEKLEHLLSQ